MLHEIVVHDCTTTTPCGILPLRPISSSVAACIKSNSPSLKCLRALGKSFGNICRCGVVSAVASGVGNFGGGAEAYPMVAVGNRSGAVRSVGSCPMALACRDPCRTAISIDGLVPRLKHALTTVVANAFGAFHACSFYRSMFGVVRPVGTHQRQVLTVLRALCSVSVGYRRESNSSWFRVPPRQSPPHPSRKFIRFQSRDQMTVMMLDHRD
jgi:hypothetical protein